MNGALRFRDLLQDFKGEFQKKKSKRKFKENEDTTVETPKKRKINNNHLEDSKTTELGIQCELIQVYKRKGYNFFGDKIETVNFTTPGTDNPALTLSDSDEETLEARSKKVRFSNVNQEHIIPSNDDYKESENGIDNAAFDIKAKSPERKSNKSLKDEGFVNAAFSLNGQDESTYKKELEVTKSNKIKNCGIANVCYNNIQETVESMEKSIESYQAEIENDLNKDKDIEMCETEVTSVNEKLEDGSIKIGVKGIVLNVQPRYIKTDDINNPKSSYRKHIKKDIIIDFKNTNLHVISGYGVVKENEI